MELTTRSARDIYAALYDLAGRDHDAVKRALEPTKDGPVHQCLRDTRPSGRGGKETVLTLFV